MNVNLNGILILNKNKRIKIGDYKGKYKTKKVKKLNNSQLKSLLMIMPESNMLTERLKNVNIKTGRKTHKRRKTRKHKRKSTKK